EVGNYMKRFRDILCVVEPEEDSRAALERASALAQSNQANLTVMAIIPRIRAGTRLPEGSPAPEELQALLAGEQMRLLDALAAPYRKLADIQVRVLHGTPFMEIIREVLRSGYDLVVRIPETRDWFNRLFGSDDMHLLRKCPCPVWMIKPDVTRTFKRILAAVDVDESYSPDGVELRRAINMQILEMSAALALSDFAELHVVHVWDAVGEGLMQSAMTHVPDDRIAAYVEQVRQQSESRLYRLVNDVAGKGTGNAMDYLKPQKHLIRGSARKEIPALVKRIGADLVVMGTIGRTGIPGFFIGNTAETVLSQINCSVLAIKPPGFETPVALDD
ncbi:MAG: universal stress protein, partial [Saprospiraceae bacterium]|nr:universal stress protein [Saprospiraceae bacterium]